MNDSSVPPAASGTVSAQLRAAFVATAYTVRLPGGGRAVIRVDAPLAPPLAALLAHARESWGYLTAWNPGAQAGPAAANRAAQHLLYRLLAGQARRCMPGVGIGAARSGTSRWREASVWALGIRPDALETLARQFGQVAYLRGCGVSPARLVLTQVGVGSGIGSGIGSGVGSGTGAGMQRE